MSTARACQSLGFVLSLVAIILYIVAAATPAFIGSDPDHNSFGPFRACLPAPSLSDEETQCVAINSDCIISVKAFDKTGDIELSHCSQINAARALHVAAILLGAVGLMVGLFVAIKNTTHVTFLVVLNVLAAIVGMCAFALVVDYYRQYVDVKFNDLFLEYKLQYGTILLGVAWGLQVLSIPLYLLGAAQSHGDHYTLFEQRVP